MHIGVDARFLGAAPTGLATYSENLLLALSRRDTTNHYTVYVHSSLRRKIKLGPNFTMVPIGGQPYSLTSMLRLSAAVRGEDFDLLHVHFPLAPLFSRCPVLVTVHDVLPFSREHTIFGARLRLWRWLWTSLQYPRALRQSKWILCVSHATRLALSQIFTDVFHKSLVVHSGVGDEFRAPIEPAMLELIRSRLNLPERYLLYSGSARADKNLVATIRAYAQLRQRNPRTEDLHFVLDISGEESTLLPIRRAVHLFRLEPYVRILHNSGDEERRGCFGEALALVVVSRHEGFGFPILEAQLCGVPVVAADAGALPEIAGEGALLVDPDNSDELVHMLERVIENRELRDYLVVRGRVNAERYTWAQTAERMQQIYELLF